MSDPLSAAASTLGVVSVLINVLRGDKPRSQVTLETIFRFIRLKDGLLLILDSLLEYGSHIKAEKHSVSETTHEDLTLLESILTKATNFKEILEHPILGEIDRMENLVDGMGIDRMEIDRMKVDRMEKTTHEDLNLLESILTKATTFREILEHPMFGETYRMEKDGIEIDGMGHLHLKHFDWEGVLRLHDERLDSILSEITENPDVIAIHNALKPEPAHESRNQNTESTSQENGQMENLFLDKDDQILVFGNSLREEASLEPSSIQLCLRDLGVGETDPRDPKDRIENNSGGLLRDLYCWILKDENFQDWQSSKRFPLLWVKGAPGMGKTTLLCGIINELENMLGDTANICFFFCQARDRRTNNAVSVLRGLINLLITKQPSLASHVQAQYETKWKESLHGPGTWNALSGILMEILKDSSLRKTYLIIDALDECTTGREALLELVGNLSLNHPTIKWIVSDQDREENLGPNHQRKLQTVKNFGDLYCELGRFDGAELMYERADVSLNQGSEGPRASTLRSSTKNSTSPNEDSYGTQTALTSADEGLSGFEAKGTIDNSDKESLYSQRTDLYSADQHISGIACILQQQLQLDPGGLSVPEFTQVTLEQCLKAFAIQLGHEVKSKESLRAMVFIRHYRKHIAISLRELWDKEIDSKRTEEDMDYNEKVKMFLETMQNDAQIHSDAFHDTEPSTSASNMFPGHSDDWFSKHETKNKNEPSLEFEYSDLIQSQAFQWLLTRLWRQVHLTTAESDNLSIIRKKILDGLPISSQVSSSRHVETYSVIFNVNWDPQSFVVEQEYGKDADEAIATAVTITGDPEFTQAATTTEYLEQTWPISGMWVLEVLRKVVLHGSGDFISDDFQITASIQEGMTIFEAHGTEELIAELGEQLAWLGSALRSSPYDKGVSYCRPRLRLTRTSTSDFSRLQKTANDRPITCFDIDFAVKQNGDVTGQEGTCWHDMFRNPVVVEGFPIPRRSNRDYGLEIPLHIMAALIRTRQVTDFDRRLFIKGFSAILFPTRVVGGTMTWHLLFNHDGSHISYLDPRIKSLQDTSAREISLVQLTNTDVNVVGWCSKANNYAGSSRAKYPINRSDCGETHATLLLDKFSITGGKYINVGASFSLGVRDKPLFLESASSYYLQILRMSEKFVLLYDVADRRAWLVNGASALLHLVIATLKYEQLTPIGKKFLNKVEDLKVVGGEYRADSAMHTLIDEENMDLPILPGKKKVTREIEKKGDSGKDKIEESSILFSDRVEQVIDYLEKAFIYQEEMLYEPGQKIKLPSRRLLAGFDFADIAESHSSIPRRIAELKSTGKAWIDFIWKIKAVALFGRGFGDIISPKEASCDPWRKMPTGVDYLAVCTYDLQNIIKRFGVRGQSDMQVVQGLYWHKPDKLFDCTCQHTKSVSCDRAQTLLPDKFKFRRFLKRIVPPGATDGSEEGAVIFGNGKKLPINWPDDPKEIAYEGQLTHGSTDYEELQVRTDPASSSVSTTSQVEEGMSTDPTEGSSSTVPSSHDGLQAIQSDTDKK